MPLLSFDKIAMPIDAKDRKFCRYFFLLIS